MPNDSFETYMPRRVRLSPVREVGPLLGVAPLNEVAPPNGVVPLHEVGPLNEVAPLKGVAPREIAPPEEGGHHTGAETEVVAATQETAGSPACDPAACAIRVREQAIALAGQACARALREAIARNPLFVARFVDDALLAAGQSAVARVRLCPDAAAACAGRVRCEVVADGAMSPGEVVIETQGGAIRATLDERAHALARAAADE